MKTLFVSIALPLFIWSGIYAQGDPCERWSIGANFTFTQPIGEMKLNGFHSNYGLTLNAFYNLTPEVQGVNFHIGGKFSGGLSRGKRDRITLADPEGASARSSIYNTLVDLSLASRLVFGSKKSVQYYFDLYGGARLTGTNHDIRLRPRIPGYDRRTSERLTQYGNWSWGSATGILIHFRENTYFDIGVNYMSSQNNRFVDLNSYSEVDDIINYDIVNSISNSIGIHVGFHVVLQCGGYQHYQDNHDDRDFQRRRLRTFKRKPKMKKAQKIQKPKN